MRRLDTIPVGLLVLVVISMTLWYLSAGLKCEEAEDVLLGLGHGVDDYAAYWRNVLEDAFGSVAERLCS